jgi:hypothetical protein
MARNFTRASSHNLNVDSIPSVGSDYSMACWAKSTSTTTAQCIAFVGDKDSSLQFDHLRFRGDVLGDPVDFESVATIGSIQFARTSTGFSSGVWHHVCGVKGGTADRSVFIDGGSKGTNTNTVTPGAAYDRVRLGGRGSTGPTDFLEGDLAEFAVWDVALTDAEVALLATGLSPLLVRPEELAMYVPILGKYSPEPDLIGGTAALTVNSAVVSAHPKIRYPSHSKVSFIVAAAPAAATYAGWPGGGW